MSWLFSETEESPRGSFLSGVVVGAVILTMVWAVWALMGGGGTDSASDGAAPAPRHARHDAKVLGTETASPSAAAATVAADPCGEVYDEQALPLRTAAASMAGWRVHVSAMNQLVAGKITLAQASDFWNQTRRQAADLLAAYDGAAGAYAARTTRCPATDRSGDQAGACHGAVTARNATLRRADAALATWRVHVHHMEMLRAGTMDPDTATRLWQKSWHAGVAQIRAYDTARSGARALAC